MSKKIGYKLIIAVGITTIIIIGVYAWFMIRAHRNELIRSVEHNVNQLSETVKNSTRYDMLLNQRERITAIIGAIGKERSIHSIRVINKIGKIIYSSRPDDVGREVDKQAESCYACHAENKPLEHLSIEQRTRMFEYATDTSRVLAVINPIYNEPSCWKSECHAHSPTQKVLGVLDVAVSLKEIDEQINRSTTNTIYFALIAILAMSVIVGIIVKKLVDSPVKELVKATNNIAVGNFNYKIKNPSKDELGNLAHSFNNMTKKLAETRLQLLQSGKLASIGRLAAGVAHEINNPLTGVLTYSSFLQKRTKDQPEIQQDLDVIVRETMRCREIVKGLLDFSRQSTPKKNMLNIQESIDKTVSVVSNQLALSNIRLAKEYYQGQPMVEGDDDQIQQVFLNLIVNAIDAIGPAGGVITISTGVVELLPFGAAQIKYATCPNKHSLLDEDHKIEGMPTIKVKVKNAGNEGFIHLDPIYGRHRHHFGIAFPTGKPASVFCPTCDVSLIHGEEKCPECRSPLLSVSTENEHPLQICSKFSCGWQRWEAVDIGGKQKYIEIKVSDTGNGIPAENLSKIFDPFFTTKGQAGTGLGLSIIWGILDNHNGKITVDSEVGKGTTFTVTLPVIGDSSNA
jgi:two-component system, NtrC family, sensor kinase